MSIESNPNSQSNSEVAQDPTVDQPTLQDALASESTQPPVVSSPVDPQRDDPAMKGMKAVGITTARKPVKQEENAWVETLKTVGLSIVLALGIRHFVAEARYIPSESMVPTLQVNDRLIVEKIGYHFHNPERGDIIVFWPPDQLRQQNPSIKDAFIKRVIGLPGETVEVRNGTVYINNQPIKENYTAAPPDYQWGPKTIPDNQYLVLGDNRNNSFDSHFWGNVPRQNIIGRAIVRFWPLNRMGEIGPIPPYRENK